MSAIDQLLEEARRDWARLEPAEAAQAMRDGALLIDTRPAFQRERDGEIAGAIVIDRNVLEWRLDPTSPHRIPQISDHDQTVIVICNEGYSSSLAAATLHRLGLRRATDVIGGVQAWLSAGLPICGRPPETVSASRASRKTI
jgi:rhodanese-related sulfurtransferase